MLILSQDKKMLYNTDTIKGLYVLDPNPRIEDQPYRIMADTNGDDTTRSQAIMGVYQNEKEAISELVKIASMATWKAVYEMR